MIRRIAVIVLAARARPRACCSGAHCVQEGSRSGRELARGQRGAHRRQACRAASLAAQRDRGPDGRGDSRSVLSR